MRVHPNAHAKWLVGQAHGPWRSRRWISESYFCINEESWPCIFALVGLQQPACQACERSFDLDNHLYTHWLMDYFSGQIQYILKETGLKTKSPHYVDTWLTFRFSTYLAVMTCLLPSRHCWWTLALRLPTAPFSHQVGLAAVRNLCRRLPFDTFHFTFFYSCLSPSVSGLSYKNHTKNHTSFWISSQTYPNHPNQASFIMANFNSRVLMKATDWGSGVTWSAWIQNCFAEIRRLRAKHRRITSFWRNFGHLGNGGLKLQRTGAFSWVGEKIYQERCILSYTHSQPGWDFSWAKSFRTSLAALWRPSSPSDQVSNMCDSTVRQDHTGSSESGMWIVNPRSSGAPSMVGSTLRWSTWGGRPSKYLTRSQGHVLNG